MDGIFALAILEHIYYLEEALVEIARVLKPTGKLFMSIPTEGGMLWNTGRRLTTDRYFSRKYGIDHAKVVRITHCNTARKVLKVLSKYFSPQRIVYDPFFIPWIDINLFVHGAYCRREPLDKKISMKQDKLSERDNGRIAEKNFLSYDPRSFIEDDVLNAGGLIGFLAQKRKEAILRLINGVLENIPNARLIDVGCGFGEILRDVKASFRYGLDANQQALNKAKDLSGADGSTFVLGTVDKIPFPSGEFDAAICSEVLEHVENPSAVITELARVVRPGGYICISVPNEWVTTIGRAVTRKKPWKSPAHKWAFTPRKIKRLFPMTLLRMENVPLRFLPFAASTNLVALFQRSK